MSDDTGTKVHDPDLLANRWLVAEKFADRTGYAIWTVHDMCRTKTLKARKRGKKWFIDMIEFDKSLREAS